MGLGQRGEGERGTERMEFPSTEMWKSVSKVGFFVLGCFVCVCFAAVVWLGGGVG